MNEDVIVPKLSVEEHEELQLQYVPATSCTYPIVLDATARPKANGTGVLIEIGNRFLVATAKHVIEHKPRIVLTKEEIIDEPTAARAIHLSQTRDLGIMEIEPDPHLKRISVENIRVGALSCPTDLELHPSEFLWIIGYPFDRRITAGNFLTFTGTLFGSFPTRITEDHFELCFRKENGVAFVADKFEPVESSFLDPSGYSGGGCWMFPKVKPGGGVVKPSDMATLHGIEYAWNDMPDNRVVKCHSIRPWLRFVYLKYPDLRDCLRDHFDFLKDR